MALEASIVQRLEELRRWQVEQQERLLQHQQEQRETLNREQVRTYQALGLTVQNTSTEIAQADIFQDSLEDNANLVPPRDKYSSILTKTLGKSNHLGNILSPKQHQLLYKPSQFSSIDQRNGSDAESTPRCMRQPNGASIDSENEFLDSYMDGTPLMLLSLDEDFIDNNENSHITDYHSSNAPVAKHKEPSETSVKFTMDGVEPLPLEKPKFKSLLIDDIPVPSPKKDFHTLLEERLRESQANAEADHANRTDQIIKKPFLKKGEGLARFRPNVNGKGSTKSIRPRTMSLPSTVKLGSSKNGKTLSEKSADNTALTKKSMVKNEKAQKKSPHIPNQPINRLNLKNVQPPARVRSKSVSVPLVASRALAKELKSNDRFNNSDIESKTKRELEEVRIFELLEEKAENSSFCSTSSTVVALLQQSVQSTPLKSRIIPTNKAPIPVHEKSKEMKSTNDDLLLAEIVYTTKSNGSVQNSSISYKQCYQNDAMTSHIQHNGARWDGVPGTFIEELTSDDNLNDSNFELPYGTDFDPNYGNDYDAVTTIDRKDKNDDVEQKMNPERNASLHVRFSEYNEYKTIGLTDTSLMSVESEARPNYSEQRVWSDGSMTTDSSDTEEYPSRDPHESTNKSELPRNLHPKFNPRTRIFASRNYSDNSCETSTEEPDYVNENNNACEANGNKATGDKNKNAGYESDGSEGVDVTLIEEEPNKDKADDEHGLVFKSELLKSRLSELEKEIEIFRKENATVTALKEKLMAERKALERNFKEKESQFEENKQKVENALQEDRKRLNREKAALDNRLKDAQVKAQQNKTERQEIQKLRDELEELKEEMVQKESRWNAAQARQRSQVRILQTENSKLKQEIEKFQSSRKTNAKLKSRVKTGVISNTKAIHQINKRLEAQRSVTNKPEISSEDDGDDCPIEPMMEAMGLNDPINHQENLTNTDGSKMIVYDNLTSESKVKSHPARKRNLYEYLLKEATMGLGPCEEPTDGTTRNAEQHHNPSEHQQQFKNANYQENYRVSSAKQSDKLQGSSSDSRHQISDSIDACTEEAGGVVSKNTDEILRSNSQEDAPEKYRLSFEREKKDGASNVYQSRKIINTKDTVSVDAQGVKEVNYPDGRTEFFYPNGNVKKVSADGMITKMIYYNGDVCESEKNGSIKYFYATTKTWHTTMPDGLEILEFPDGQVERRSTDGTVEVSFPDGSVRIVQSDGTEKWALPDGTIAETSMNGEKILILPNGQREVHTPDHKRREYPDGTVKLVYPDGSQETRYAGGRIRLKDKDGNLIMDSYQQ